MSTKNNDSNVQAAAVEQKEQTVHSELIEKKEKKGAQKNSSSNQKDSEVQTEDSETSRMDKLENLVKSLQSTIINEREVMNKKIDEQSTIIANLKEEIKDLKEENKELRLKLENIDNELKAKFALLNINSTTHEQLLLSIQNKVQYIYITLYGILYRDLVKCILYAFQIALNLSYNGDYDLLVSQIKKELHNKQNTYPSIPNCDKFLDFLNEFRKLFNKIAHRKTIDQYSLPGLSQGNFTPPHPPPLPILPTGGWGGVKFPCDNHQNQKSHDCILCYKVQLVFLSIQ